MKSPLIQEKKILKTSWELFFPNENDHHRKEVNVSFINGPFY